MTPKEKAQQLVSLFYNNAESRNKIGAFDKDLHQHNCKQCALVLVSELIKENLRYDYIPFKDSRSAFYLQVEQELNKL